MNYNQKDGPDKGDLRNDQKIKLTLLAIMAIAIVLAMFRNAGYFGVL
jgi:hypothetical protein